MSGMMVCVPARPMVASDAIYRIEVHFFIAPISIPSRFLKSYILGIGDETWIVGGNVARLQIPQGFVLYRFVGAEADDLVITEFQQLLDIVGTPRSGLDFQRQCVSRPFRHAGLCTVVADGLFQLNRPAVMLKFSMDLVVPIVVDEAALFAFGYTMPLVIPLPAPATSGSRGAWHPS